MMFVGSHGSRDEIELISLLMRASFYVFLC